MIEFLLAWVITCSGEWRGPYEATAQPNGVISWKMPTTPIQAWGLAPDEESLIAWEQMDDGCFRHEFTPVEWTKDEFPQPVSVQHKIFLPSIGG